MSYPAIRVSPGERYGYLTVIEVLSGPEVDRDSSRGRWALVRCDCGTRKMVRVRHLRLIKSCGCRKSELLRERWHAARTDERRNSA